MVSQPKEFSFLIVSDIHESMENVKKLVEYYSKTQTKFDYILCCGDIVTVPNNEQDFPESAKKYEPMIADLFKELEKICPNIVYVPGNHEPYTTFKEDSPQLTKGTIGLHKKYLKLTDDLYMIGLGGSPPILHGDKYSNEQIPFKDVNVKQYKWDGYPYNVDKTEENYPRSDAILLKDLMVPVEKLKKEVGDKASLILLSHVGPLYTLTNYMNIANENIYLGSEQLGQWFVDEKNCFLNIHGHSHPAKGVINIMEKKTVINPGDLASGNYAVIKIKKNNDEWTLESTSLCLL